MDSEKILVVEDNPDHLDLIQTQLKCLGWDSEAAIDGQEALTKVKAFRPKLILLDIRIPKINGIEVARCLKGDPDYKHIPIVAITAVVMPEVRERCLKAGCNGYLPKPFTHKDLKAHLEGLLAGMS